MESIKFAKLISPYQEDITLGCKWSVEDLDYNLLTLKNNDIKLATYNSSTYVISIEKNDGEKIIIDISAIKDDIHEQIYEEFSGYTPTSGACEIDLEASVSEDGVLTLYWSDGTGRHSTSASGFVVTSDVFHDETIKGDGTNESPIGINDTEITGHYKSVKGIVEELPESIGFDERYVKKETTSSFGRLYSKNGFKTINELLNGNSWRIPTKEDWDKLLNYVDTCDTVISGNSIGSYQGDVCGKMLKSINYWLGNENLDEYGFCAFPSGYVFDGILEGEDKECRFWTNTAYDSSASTMFIKGFSYNNDGVLQDIESIGGYYSIRLVMDIDSDFVSDTINIFGKTYHVINFAEIKQAWIVENLDYETEASTSMQYQYNHDGVISEKYFMNHWDGKKWTKKQLSNGDQFNVLKDNAITEYTCGEDNNGNQYLIKGIIYKTENNIRKMIIDAGWY